MFRNKTSNLCIYVLATAFLSTNCSNNVGSINSFADACYLQIAGAEIVSEAINSDKREDITRVRISYNGRSTEYNFFLYVAHNTILTSATDFSGEYAYLCRDDNLQYIAALRINNCETNFVKGPSDSFLLHAEEKNIVVNCFNRDTEKTMCSLAYPLGFIRGRFPDTGKFSEDTLLHEQPLFANISFEKKDLGCAANYVTIFEKKVSKDIFESRVLTFNDMHYALRDTKPYSSKYID